MNTNKTEYLKTRCTAEEKKVVTELANTLQVPVSNLVMSAIHALIESQVKTPSSKPVINDYTHTIQKYLLLNSVQNIINLNPTIPDTTKQKIYKELKNYELTY